MNQNDLIKQEEAKERIETYIQFISQAAMILEPDELEQILEATNKITQVIDR